MKTLVIQTPESVSGKGFKKLGYIRLRFKKNDAAITDKISFAVTMAKDAIIFIEGAANLKQEGSENSGVSLQLLNGKSYLVSVTDIQDEMVYVYIPNDAIATFEPPYKLGGYSAIMAYLELEEFTKVKSFSMTWEKYYSYTITDDIETAFKAWTALVTFSIKGYLLTETQDFVIKDASISLPSLASFDFMNSTIPNRHLEIEFLKNSHVLTSMQVVVPSGYTVNLSWFPKYFTYFYILTTEGRYTAVGALSDMAKANNVLYMKNADFTKPYQVGTIWKNNISEIGAQGSNMSVEDCDNFLIDLYNNLDTLTYRKQLFLPRRSAASDEAVAALTAKGWNIYV